MNINTKLTEEQIKDFFQTFLKRAPEEADMITIRGHGSTIKAVAEQIWDVMGFPLSPQVNLITRAIVAVLNVRKGPAK